MNDGQGPSVRTTMFTYDRAGQLLGAQELSEEQVREYRAGLAAADRPPGGFEHDREAHVFRLTAADGTVRSFRDDPTRYLCVEPDSETGMMRPVMRRNRPLYLHLCREEREAR